MTRYQDILGLIVKSMLVLLIAGLVVTLFWSLWCGQELWLKATGGTVSIGSIIALMDRFHRYDTLSRATRITKNLDDEVVKEVLRSLNGKMKDDGR
jgi:hypothetical protein